MRTLQTKHVLLISVLFLLHSCTSSPNDDEKRADSLATAQEEIKTQEALMAAKEEKVQEYFKKNNFKTAEVLIYPAGSIINITDRAIQFPHLEIGDNSKIIVDESLDSCTLIIRKFQFGKNCEIIADGKPGISAGRNPKDPWLTIPFWQAGKGRDGDQGVQGVSGSPGTDATNMEIELEILAYGDLSIHANGGNGGDGGPGGNGQIGGNKGGGATFLRPCGNGGKGGTAGNGGDAGNGAYLSVKIWPSNPSTNLGKLEFVRANAKKGSPGIAGKPGDGGHRGNVKCSHGLPGDNGSNGAQKKDGIVKMQPIGRPTNLLPGV